MNNDSMDEVTQEYFEDTFINWEDTEKDNKKLDKIFGHLIKN